MCQPVNVPIPTIGLRHSDADKAHVDPETRRTQLVQFAASLTCPMRIISTQTAGIDWGGWENTLRSVDIHVNAICSVLPPVSVPKWCLLCARGTICVQHPPIGMCYPIDMPRQGVGQKISRSCTVYVELEARSRFLIDFAAS
jgi:hypothetical protein